MIMKLRFDFKWGLVLLTVSVMLAGCSFSNKKSDEAVSLIMEKSYAEAEQCLKEAEDAGEDMMHILRTRGILELARGDYDKAVSFFEECLSNSDGYLGDIEYDVSYYLATAQYKAGKLQDAIETCSANILLRANSVDAHFIRGRMKLAAGDFDGAISDFNKIIELDGENPELYIQIYESMNENGYDEQGKMYLDELVRLSDSGNVRLTDFQKGKLAFSQERYEDAREYLEKARSEGVPGIILYLGKTYEALKDLKFAASLYQSYLEKYPEDGEVWNQLGLCCTKFEAYDDAINAFEKAKSGSGDINHEALLFNEAVVYEYKGDFETAGALMSEYLKAYPDDGTAKKEYAFLKSRIDEMREDESGG